MQGGISYKTHHGVHWHTAEQQAQIDHRRGRAVATAVASLWLVPSARQRHFHPPGFQVHRSRPNLALSNLHAGTSYSQFSHCASYNKCMMILELPRAARAAVLYSTRRCSPPAPHHTISDMQFGTQANEVVAVLNADRTTYRKTRQI